MSSSSSSSSTKQIDSNITSRRVEMHEIELSTIQPGGTNGALWALPKELFAAILLNLSPRDIANVIQCNRAHRERICCVGASKNADRFWFTAFWRALFERDSSQWSAFESPESFKSDADAFASSSSSAASSAPPASRSVFDAFVAAIGSAIDSLDSNGDAGSTGRDDEAALLATLSDEERRQFHRRHSTPWSEASWYALYVHQHTLNRRANQLASVQSPPAMSHISNAHNVQPKRSMLAAWAGLPQGVYRIPMFGTGVRSTAKKYLYRMMHEPNMGLKVTRLHPGLGVLTGGLGAGVGFDCDGVELSLSVLQMPPDESAKATATRAQLWKLLIHEAACYIFILGPVDSSRRAFVELQNNLSPRWAAPDVPVVVVSLYDPAAPHEVDEPDDDDRDAMISSSELEVPITQEDDDDNNDDDDNDNNDKGRCRLQRFPRLRSNPREVATALRLAEFKRPWVVFTTNVDKPTNVGAALQYAAKQVQTRAWEQRILKPWK
jgi:hypothetical protein